MPARRATVFSSEDVNKGRHMLQEGLGGERLSLAIDGCLRWTWALEACSCSATLVERELVPRA